MATSVSLDWMVEEGQKLAECKHHNPFAVLGPQPYKNEWIVRAWMPEASKVEFIFDGKTIAMTNPNHHWIFETLLNQNPGSNYKFKVFIL